MNRHGIQYSWGDILNAVRAFHIEFYERFPYEHASRLTQEDLESQALGSQNHFQFPDSTQGYAPYYEAPLTSAIADWIELHPVERFLIEGPLAMTETIDLANEAQVNLLFKQVLALEKAWILAMKHENEAMQLEATLQMTEQAFARMMKQFFHRPKLRLIS